MRALVQRVRRASVTVEEQVIGAISRGLVLLVGIAKSDGDEDGSYLAGKVVNMRVFPDTEGRLSLSALETGSELLVISQFTLYADTRRGRRPSFVAAAGPEEARTLFEAFAARLRATGIRVATGRFQEHMLVAMENDGPLTILLDSSDRHRSKALH